MNSYVIKLYKKYLYSSISEDEFRELRYNINHTSDEELLSILEEEWNDDFFQSSLHKNSKGEMLEQINFYIENEKSLFFTPKAILKIIAICIPIVLISVCSLALFLPSDNNRNNFIVSVESGNKAMVTLPDQSNVWMNSNSIIEYSQDRTNMREVKLKGEAFFKIKKSSGQPFLVSMNDLQIEVLGTSFNVKALDNSDIIEASLLEGSIKLRSPSLAYVYYLNPNEKAIYTKSKKQLQILPTNFDSEIDWKDNILKFSSKKFIDVLTMLSDWYGVKFINKYPEIENDLLSGTFKDEKLETVLSILKIQYKIRYIENRDTITIVKE